MGDPARAGEPRVAAPGAERTATAAPDITTPTADDEPVEHDPDPLAAPLPLLMASASPDALAAALVQSPAPASARRAPGEATARGAAMPLQPRVAVDDPLMPDTPPAPAGAAPTRAPRAPAPVATAPAAPAVPKPTTVEAASLPTPPTPRIDVAGAVVSGSPPHPSLANRLQPPFARAPLAVAERASETQHDSVAPADSPPMPAPAAFVTGVVPPAPTLAPAQPAIPGDPVTAGVPAPVPAPTQPTTAPDSVTAGAPAPALHQAPATAMSRAPAGTAAAASAAPTLVLTVGSGTGATPRPAVAALQHVAPANRIAPRVASAPPQPTRQVLAALAQGAVAPLAAPGAPLLRATATSDGPAGGGGAPARAPVPGAEHSAGHAPTAASARAALPTTGAPRDLAQPLTAPGEQAASQRPAGPAPDLAAVVRDPAPSLAPAIVAGAAAPAFRLFAAAIHAARRDEADAVATTPLAAAGQPVASLPVAAPQGAPLDLTDHRWPHAMVERIEALRDAAGAAADAADTSIRLVPDSLGTIDVSVRTDGESVHVHFAAEQATTRTLLTEAQGRLAELAEARGLKLGQASVGAGTDQGSQRPPAQQPRGPAPATASAGDDPETATTRIA